MNKPKPEVPQDDSGPQTIRWSKLRFRLTPSELVALVVAVLAAWGWLNDRFARLEERLREIELRAGLSGTASRPVLAEPTADATGGLPRHP